jgi:hypothetical protein
MCNRDTLNGFAPSIITPGVDLNDGLVFPANSSSSTPTTVSERRDITRTARHHRKSPKRIGLQICIEQSKIRQKRIAVSFRYGSFVLLVHYGTNKIIHTGTLSSLSHVLMISPFTGNPRKNISLCITRLKSRQQGINPRMDEPHGKPARHSGNAVSYPLAGLRPRR